MVMACCNHTYVKYINEDGTPDLEAIKELERQDVESIKQYVIKIANDPNHDFRKPTPCWKPIRCQCMCHQKGCAVRH